jgi:hypothetical protein
MLERVKKLFEDYTYENIALNLTAVYADEFYFRDAFKQFTKPRRAPRIYARRPQATISGRVRLQ